MKKLLGVDVDGSWIFSPDNAGLGTIEFTGITLRLEQILLIVNTTRNAIIYNFADPANGAASYADNLLTLAAETGGDSSVDSLMIYVDVDEPQEIEVHPHGTLAMMLTRIVSILLAPLGYAKDLQRYRATTLVESGTVTTVTTVTTLTTLNQLNGLSSDRLIYSTNLSAWADCHRSRIT